jgi:hypothetical protein
MALPRGITGRQVIVRAYKALYRADALSPAANAPSTSQDLVRGHACRHGRAMAAALTLGIDAGFNPYPHSSSRAEPIIDHSQHPHRTPGRKNDSSQGSSAFRVPCVADQLANDCRVSTGGGHSWLLTSQRQVNAIRNPGLRACLTWRIW